MDLRRRRVRARSRWRRVINITLASSRIVVKLSAEYADRMMAQHVGRSRLAPATILLLLISACVNQLANVDASASATTVGHLDYVHGDLIADDDDDALSRVQSSIKSARMTTAPAALSALHVDKLFVEFLGTGLDHDLTLRWSSTSHDCPNDPNADLDVVWTSPSGDRAIYEFHTEFPRDAEITDIYFCRRNNGTDTFADAKWNSLGDHVSIKFPIRSK